MLGNLLDVSRDHATNVEHLNSAFTALNETVQAQQLALNDLRLGRPAGVNSSPRQLTQAGGPLNAPRELSTSPSAGPLTTARAAGGIYPELPRWLPRWLPR